MWSLPGGQSPSPRPWDYVKTPAKGLPCQKAVLGLWKGLPAQPGCRVQAGEQEGSSLGVWVAAGPCWWLTLPLPLYFRPVLSAPEMGASPAIPGLPAP